MTDILAFILTRLREASTWRGLVLLATAAGAGLTPAHQEAVITAGVGLAGLLAVLLPDRLGSTR